MQDRSDAVLTHDESMLTKLSAFDAIYALIFKDVINAILHHGIIFLISFMILILLGCFMDERLVIIKLFSLSIVLLGLLFCHLIVSLLSL